MSQHKFLSGTIGGFTHALQHALESEELARVDGWLQRLDPRVKLVGLLALVVATAASRKLSVVLLIFAVALVMAMASHVQWKTLFTRVWLPVLGFTGVIAVPAIFLTPGEVFWRSPFGVVHVTHAGLRAAAMLVSRVETAATMSTLLILCTPWTHVLKALRSLHVPVEIVAILMMTHRYVYLLIETANEMFVARQSRMVGRLDAATQRRVATRTGGVLLSKTVQLGEEVHLAMQARGFRGDVRLLDQFRMETRDYAALMLLLGITAAALYVGH